MELEVIAEILEGKLLTSLPEVTTEKICPRDQPADDPEWQDIGGCYGNIRNESGEAPVKRTHTHTKSA